MLAIHMRMLAASTTSLLALVLVGCDPSEGGPLSPEQQNPDVGGSILQVVTTVDWDFAAIIPGVLDPEDLGLDEAISLAGSGFIGATVGAPTEHITVKGRSLPVGDTERGLGLCLTEEGVTCTFPADGDEVGDGGPGTLLLDFSGVLPANSILESIDLGSLQVDEGYMVSISTDSGATFGAPIIGYDGDASDNKTLVIGLPTLNLVLKLEKAPDIAPNDNDYTVKSVTTSFETEEGCTLTLGYWKTHNESADKAPPDDNWLNITPNAEQTGFFTTDAANSYPTTGPNAPPFTWFTVFWTSVGGNAYYQLAHQYMAAKLNILNGADPSAVSTAIADAEDLFDTHTPADIAGLKGNDPLRQQFITLAGTLGSYNEGTTGPGHCPEEEPVLTTRSR